MRFDGKDVFDIWLSLSYVDQSIVHMTSMCGGHECVPAGVGTHAYTRHYLNNNINLMLIQRTLLVQNRLT